MHSSGVVCLVSFLNTVSAFFPSRKIVLRSRILTLDVKISREMQIRDMWRRLGLGFLHVLSWLQTLLFVSIISSLEQLPCVVIMGYWFCWHAYNCRIYTRLACRPVFLSWRIDMPYLESFVFYFAFEVNYDYIADNLTSNINPSSWLLAIKLATKPKIIFLSHF